MVARKLQPGWLRRAQEAQQKVNSRFAERGPVSNLPVPDDTDERITAEELEQEASS